MSTKINLGVARLKELKKLGVLKEIKNPTKKAPLTKTQESKIREAYKKMAPIINKPESFKKISVEKYQKQDIENLKNTGYIVANGKAFLPKQGYDTISIRRDYVKNEDGNLERVFNIIRKTKSGRKVEEEIVGNRQEKAAWRERLRHEYNLKKLKKGEFFGVKVWENGVFNRNIFTDFDDMMNYVDTDMAIKEDTDFDTFVNNMHIVKLKVNDVRDLRANEKTEKQKNRENYLARKKKALRGGIKKKK